MGCSAARSAPLLFMPQLRDEPIGMGAQLDEPESQRCKMHGVATDEWLVLRDDGVDGVEVSRSKVYGELQGRQGRADFRDLLIVLCHAGLSTQLHHWPRRPC